MPSPSWRIRSAYQGGMNSSESGSASLGSDALHLRVEVPGVEEARAVRVRLGRDRAHAAVLRLGAADHQDVLAGLDVRRRPRRSAWRSGRAGRRSRRRRLLRPDGSPMLLRERCSPLTRSREAGKESNVARCRHTGVEGPARRRGDPPDALAHRARDHRAQRRPRRGRAGRHPHARRPARAAPARPDRGALRRRARRRPARHHLPPRRRSRARRQGAAPARSRSCATRGSTSSSRAAP